VSQFWICLAQGGIIKRVKQASRGFFVQDMLLVILLSSVLIHWELTPSGELIRNEQKNHAKSMPILDFCNIGWSS
jgi:hypothetical protein